MSGGRKCLTIRFLMLRLKYSIACAYLLEERNSVDTNNIYGNVPTE